MPIISGSSNGRYQDRKLDGIYEQIVHETDRKKLKSLMRQFEKRLLDEEAHNIITLWWHRTVPYNANFKGWKVSPSHYLNQSLANVWVETD